MSPRLGQSRAKLLLASAGAVAALAAFTGCDLQENADTDRGEQLFTQKCGSCHVLAGAGTNGAVGPNLDDAFAAARGSGMDQDTIEGVVTHQISNPRPASPEDTEVYMPAELVTGEDADAVAAYVASVAGVPGIEPPVFSAPEFFATNCGGCHVLSQAGTTGQTGPNLDEGLAGMSPDQISEQIVNPNSQVAAGFQPGVMPQNYGEILQPDQLQQLVDYLSQATGGGGGGGGGGGK
ncbi:MAG: c-type cytochrome [Solirubrobacterales bacterium]